MRKRFAITLAAGGRWPDAATGSIGFNFNWVKVDNRGSNPVDLGLNATPAAGDTTDNLLTVQAGQVRVFNIAGPMTDHEGKASGENWAQQVYLVSASGTKLILEVSDHPIVDIQASPVNGNASVVRIEDAFAGTLASVTANNAGDGVNQVQALDVIAYPYGYNGATWDRDRSASAANLAAQSGIGAGLAAPPGTWSVPNAAAVGSASSASKAAGAAGVRHVCTNVSFGFSATTALGAITTVTVNLRDGATGAGTVLKTWQFTLPAATILPIHVELSGLSEVGSAATAMTLEFSAGVANLLTYCNLGGYDAS